MSDELNKKIAELKGLCWHEFDEWQKEHNTGWNISCIKCKGCYEQLKDNPDWQNNIADAWELFEELHLPTLIRKANGTYIVKWDLGKYEGKTAPEAICKAYIQWRDNG